MEKRYIGIERVKEIMIKPNGLLPATSTIYKYMQDNKIPRPLRHKYLGRAIWDEVEVLAARDRLRQPQS